MANIPGDSVDDGQVIYDLLFPLVLPEGDGDHRQVNFRPQFWAPKTLESCLCFMFFLTEFFNFRFGYFVFKQPRRLSYADEGGPTDSCSSNMSNGRGPFR